MWLKPQGYASVVSPMECEVVLDPHRQRAQIGVGTAEYDTATCKHCNGVFHVGARQRPDDIGGLCKTCMGIICPRCLGKPCKPFMKRLEEMERKEDALRSYGF
jgi:hypothetical protein